MKRDAAAEYLAGHIPGAVRFDIDAIADHSNPCPICCRTPSSSRARSARSASPIATPSSCMTVRACFPRRGCGGHFVCSAPRTCSSSMAAFRSGRPNGARLKPAPVKRAPRTFEARKAADIVASLDAVRAALQSKSAQVVDARPADRFVGAAPEPRAGVRSGHMPGAFNVPSSAMVENGSLASPEKLRAAFAAGGVDLDRPIITSCGSGRVRRNALARARCPRQGTQGALRRFMVGMGSARRFAGRTEGLIHGAPGSGCIPPAGSGGRKTLPRWSHSCSTATRRVHHRGEFRRGWRHDAENDLRGIADCLFLERHGIFILSGAAKGIRNPQIGEAR